MGFEWIQMTGSAYNETDTTGGSTFGSNTVDQIAFKRIDKLGTVSAFGDYAMGTLESQQTSYPICMRPCFISSNNTGISAVTVENIYFWLFRNGDADTDSVNHNYLRPGGGDPGYNFSFATINLHTVPYSTSPGTYYNTISSGMPNTPTALVSHTDRLAYSSGMSVHSGAGTITDTYVGAYKMLGDYYFIQLVVGAGHPLGNGGQSLYLMQYDIAT